VTASHWKTGEAGFDDRFDDDDEEMYLFGGDEDDEDEEAWQLRPEWLHPDCRNVCSALELGTCCKYPDNPLVGVAADLAGALDALLGRLGGDCAETAGELARMLKLVPGLLAQIHAILPRLNKTAVAQLLCPVGRLAGALDQVCDGGCPWACGDPLIPDRRAEFEPMIELVAECSVAVRTVLSQRTRRRRGYIPGDGFTPGSNAARR